MTSLNRTTIDLGHFRGKPSYLAGAIGRCGLSALCWASRLWGSFEDSDAPDTPLPVSLWAIHGDVLYPNFFLP